MSADYYVSRSSQPHLRCGICDEPFEVADDTVYLDDERCHRACAMTPDDHHGLDCGFAIELLNPGVGPINPEYGLEDDSV